MPPVQGTRSVQLRIDQINLPAENPRGPYSARRFKKLKASIERFGILVPVIVRPISADEYAVVDGFTRLQAAHELGWTGGEEVPAAVLDTDDRDTLVASVVINQERERLSKLSEWRVLRSLRAKGMTHAEAGSALGKSRPWATRLLSLDTLPAEVLSDVESGEIGLAHAAVLADFLDEPRVFEELLKRARQGTVSSHALRRVGEVASKRGITAAKALVPKKVDLSDASWVRFEPVRDAVRAELHLAAGDDIDQVLAAMRGKLEALHKALGR